MSEPLSYIEGVDPATLQNFEDAGYTDEEALALAQGPLEDAVPCLPTIYPDFSSADKTAVKFAVLEMAKYIKEDYFRFERATSPFQSETIGSYTYNKMSSSIRSKETTGVPGFDRAVSKFAILCDIAAGSEGTFSTSTEQVFKPGYNDYITNRESRIDINRRVWPYGGWSTDRWI